MHKKSLAPLNFIGIPVFMTGFIFIIGMVIITIRKGSILNLIGSAADIIEPVLSSFLTKGIITGAITAVAGACMVTLYILLRKAQRKRVQLAGVSAGEKEQ
jgi:hypothetical protein